MKIFFCDTETTGTNPLIHSIHQLSGMMVIDGIIVETVNYNVRPHPQAKIDEEALKVSGVTKEQILAYPEIETVHKQFTDMLGKYVKKFDKTDKAYFAGYNTHFDNDFVRQLFDDVGDKYFGSWFWSDRIEVMTLASLMLRNKRASLVNFKLMTVANALGLIIDETKAHDALYDIEVTKWIYDKYITMHHQELIPSVQRNSEINSINDLISSTIK